MSELSKQTLYMLEREIADVSEMPEYYKPFGNPVVPTHVAERWIDMVKSDLQSQLQAAQAKIKELEKKLNPDMFWLADDGESSFDRLDELADYHLDSYECETKPIQVKIQQAASLPNANYEFSYDAEVNEWNYKSLPPQPKENSYEDSKT